MIKHKSISFLFYIENNRNINLNKEINFKKLKFIIKFC